MGWLSVEKDLSQGSSPFHFSPSYTHHTVPHPAHAQHRHRPREQALRPDAHLFQPLWDTRRTFPSGVRFRRLCREIIFQVEHLSQRHAAPALSCCCILLLQSYLLYFCMMACPSDSIIQKSESRKTDYAPSRGIFFVLFSVSFPVIGNCPKGSFGIHFFYGQQPVILRHPFPSAGCAGLDLPAASSHSQIGQK